jgi:hypothetical protein
MRATLRAGRRDNAYETPRRVDGSTPSHPVIGRRAMSAQASARCSLRVLEKEITHLESETLPQFAAARRPLYVHWQAYVIFAHLLRAKLRLQRLYEERRRLWAELQA